ncbi:MAG: glycerophosphoryl diester phosphodiesterase membrane domain-containing protein [Candidatus Limnocylindrales bacterium]
MSAWSSQPGSTWYEPPRPAFVPRRPIGDVLRVAFRVYSRSFVPFVALSAVVCGLISLILAPAELALADIAGTLLAATPATGTAGDLSTYQAAVNRLGPQESVLELIVTVLSGLMGVLALSVVIAGTPEAAVGQPVRFGTAFRRFIHRLPPVLGLGVPVIAIQAGATVLEAFLQLRDTGVAAADPTDLAQASSAAVALIVFGLLAVFLEGVTLYLYARWFVALPLIIADGQGVRAAMRRSAQLTHGSRLYILGVLLLLVLIQAALTIGVELLAAIIGVLVGAGSIDSGSTLTNAGLGTLFGRFTAFSSIVGLGMVAVFYPVIAIAMAVLRSDFVWRADATVALAAQHGPPPAA